MPELMRAAEASMCDEVGGAGGQMVCVSCKMTSLIGIWILSSWAIRNLPGRAAEVQSIYGKNWSEVEREVGS